MKKASEKATSPSTSPVKKTHKPLRIVVGMSGGVDSSLAAALVKEAGYEALGVTMELSRKEQIDAPGFINHGSYEEAMDARAVAQKVDIPFETWDMSELYKDKVVLDFVEKYSRGLTPNPCVACNNNVKFAALVAKSTERGYDLVATGHYARVLRVADLGYQKTTDAKGQLIPELHRGVNPRKDQSYFVASMPPEVVRYCYFPLGDYFDKAEVREAAKIRGFETHDKKDSSDICFLAKNAKTKFLGHHFKDQYAGNIVDLDGNILGQHAGFWNFTVGQRQGLDLKIPAADGKPRYVIRTDPKTCEVIVGPKSALLTDTVECNEVKLFDPNLPCDNTKFVALAQIRAHGKAVKCEFTYDKALDKLVALANDLDFDSVAAGQSLVAYDPEFNSRVLLKATIVI